MPLNFVLMRRWENWATILLMVSIGFFALNFAAKIGSKKEA
jgi:hypothetical protein